MHDVRKGLSVFAPARPITVTLHEWQRLRAADCGVLRGLSFDDHANARLTAAALGARLRIREERSGLSVESSSWVGSIDLGPLRIHVVPKLSSADFSILLRYAYRLRDLRVFQETSIATSPHGLQDLLVRMLVDEMSELVRRGLPKRYVVRRQALDSPRGRILVERISRRPIVDARLMCEFHDRSLDWELNRVLRGGLSIAASVAHDIDLSRAALRLAERFGEIEPITIDLSALNAAISALTRQTEAARTALVILRMLVLGRGVALHGAGDDRSLGFLFDMNRFFQRLLSRFLRENLDQVDFRDERAIHALYALDEAAPRRRIKLPKPRPDFAIFDGGLAKLYLDAKYKDLTGDAVPAGWLYQLSIYALAASEKHSVLLHASEIEGSDTCIALRDPSGRTPSALGHVIVRPVPLSLIARLVGRTDAASARERRHLARRLIATGGSRA